MAPIIGTESPFRRMPVDMPRRQILYLDALRLSAEIADTAYDRLHNLLTGITEERHVCVTGNNDQQGAAQAHNSVPAILDAYSMIDSVHRFRELLQVTPGLKHNAHLSFSCVRRKMSENYAILCNT